MRRSRALLLSCAAALGLALLFDAPPVGASNANRDILQELDEDGADLAAIKRRLIKVTTILAKADNRLDAIEAVFVDNPDILDGVDNPDLLPPLALIHAQGEGILASVEAIDGGTGAGPLARRLDRVSSTLAGASGRLDALADGWQTPPDGDMPGGTAPPDADVPDVCAPAVEADLDAVATSAELLASRAGELDACSSPASVARRLGHVTAGLAAAGGRLDALAAGWQTPPDPDVPALDAELDAIIAQATSVLTAAQALKSGEQAPPDPDAPPTGP